MSDFLLEIARRPAARFVYRRLPVPMDLPPLLRRGEGPWESTPLAGVSYALAVCGPSALADGVRQVLERGGATPAEENATALVADATGVRRVSELESIYAFFHERIAKVPVGGRVLVVGRRPDQVEEVEESACQEALVGFVRSVAKETGRRGITAQLVLLPGETAEATASLATRLTGPLHYFLSRRSAYVSGQVLRLDAAVAPPPDLAERGVAPLHGKKALVTGAARGIGATIARFLAREGASVVGVDHPSQRALLDETMKTLGGKGLALDLADEASFAKLTAEVATLGGLDVLVNNAGITRDRTLAKMPPESWRLVLRVNLEAPLRIVQALAGGDLLHRDGRILFLSSVVGLSGNFGQSNYAAAKAGLVGLVRSQAPRLAARGITANAIAPGFIDTPMTREIPFLSREIARRFCSLKQGGLPEDVAEAAVFLVSHGAFAVNGEVLRVCGQNVVGA